MKIVFFLASLSQPRCIKRVRSLLDLGYDVQVYGYYRGYYDVNKLPDTLKVIVWGNVESGDGYLRKSIKNAKNIFRVLKSHSSEDKILYYAFGFDLAFWLSFFCKRKYIYESSDLLYTYLKPKFLISFFKVLDRFIIGRSFRTVFTSEGFAEYLFPCNRPKNIIIQPNKVAPCFKQIKRMPISKKDKEGIVFSYVGAFRSPDTVFRFAKVIGEFYPQHKFYFYGDSNLTYLAQKLSSKYNNVKYFGRFKNPEDLETIYNSIDIVVACYDTKDINEKIADPNKLYEAICFCKPIIVSSNTFLAEQVKRMNVGFAIDPHSDTAIRDFIDHFDLDEINRISRHETLIPENIYIDSISEISKSISKFGL